MAASDNAASVAIARARGNRNLQKSLLIIAEKCTGCSQCELACSYAKESVFNAAKSRIKIFDFPERGLHVPYTCTQCAEAWCMQACPVDAISTNDATGAKIVSQELCVGCKVCTIACPFGTINYQQDSGKVVKCDLCDDSPACVEICPTDAILYVDADATGMDRMRQWAEKTSAGAQSTAE
jgi:Fe-S-cluster-containing hydrogenase component 2